MLEQDADRKTTHVETAAAACPERSRRGCPAEQSSAAPLPNIQRRVFLATSVATIAGLALWQWRKPSVLNAAPTAVPEPREVAIVLFSDSGQRLKKVQIAKVIKTADEWRKQLPPGVFDITRNADTEIAFSGKYWNRTKKETTASISVTMQR